MKRMAMVTSSLAIVAIILGLLIVGCASPAPSAAPGAAPAQTKTVTAAPVTVTATAAAAAKATTPEFTYKVANYNTDASTLTVITQYWISLVEKLSAGRIKFELVNGEGLVKAADTFASLSNGMIKVAFLNGAYHTGQMPLYLLVNLPYSAKSGYLAAAAEKEMVPIFQKALDKWNIKYMWTVPFCEFIVCTKKPVATLADMKGKILKSPGGVDLQIASAWGTSGVAMTNPEVYTALQRGTIDGALTTDDSYNAFRFYEVAPYVTYYRDIKGQPPSWGVHWNQPDFNKLPKDLQDTILLASQATLWYGTDLWYQNLVDLRTSLVTKGAKYNFVSDEEVAKWKAAVLPSVWDWAKAQAVKGGASAADVDAVMAIMKKWSSI